MPLLTSGEQIILQGHRHIGSGFAMSFRRIPVRRLRLRLVWSVGDLIKLRGTRAEPLYGAFRGRGGDTTKVIERADDELDEYLGAYYGQPLDVMRYVQAIRGGSVAECLDWLARYVEAGALHLILRIGSLTAGPESVAEQLLPALKEIE